MLDCLAPFREMNAVSVLLRLCLAMFFGGIVGLERGKKRRAAGFRTYMMVCLGATLTMLLGQYEAAMVNSVWGATVSSGTKTDVSRFGAQVINGIGFLGAGTIVITKRQSVEGLTTAAGLWATACTGLAIGAGFYEGVFLAFLLIILVVRVLPAVEVAAVSNSKNMIVYVELESLECIGQVIGCIKENEGHIYDIEMDRGQENRSWRPNAIFTIRLRKRKQHEKLLVAISALTNVFYVEET